jgi:hypothetical protein
MTWESGSIAVETPRAASPIPTAANEPPTPMETDTDNRSIVTADSTQRRSGVHLLDTYRPLQLATVPSSGVVVPLVRDLVRQGPQQMVLDLEEPEDGRLDNDFSFAVAERRLHYLRRAQRKEEVVQHAFAVSCQRLLQRLSFRQKTAAEIEVLRNLELELNDVKTERRGFRYRMIRARYWSCCKCGDGSHTLAIVPACPECAHWTCQGCFLEGRPGCGML